jgi:pimeloyl-ACP methyl ester carboxylesterase
VYTFTSFDGLRIAYHDEGEGPAVVLLHGFGVDALGQFRDFERIRATLEKRQQMFREFLGGALPLPNPPADGRTGLAHALPAAGAGTILPDMRGFGASDKPREKEDTPILPWPVTSSPSSSTCVWTQSTSSVSRWDAARRLACSCCTRPK